MNTALTIDDLSVLERTYLGVLAVGLVPEDLACDPRFRMEVIAATCQALREHRATGSYLDGVDRTTADFREQLRLALIDLDRKRVIGIGPPQDLVILRPEASLETAYGAVDVNRHPPIFDRYLAQRCMDELLNDPAIYRYIMDLYADSGEVWAELYKQGYGDHR